jgi:hypothetical protein
MENNVTFTVGVSDIAKQVIAEMEGQKKLIRTIAEFLTAKETAEFLKVDISSLYRFEKTGYLVPVRVGKKRLYRIEDLENILQGKK